MVTRSSTLFRVLAALLLVALVAGGACMAFKAGQAQGYAMGIATEASPAIDGESGGVMLFFPGGMMPYRPFFSPFSGLIGLFLAIIFISFVFKLIGFIVFRHPYRLHRNWKYGPYPHHPWPCGYPFDEPPLDESGRDKSPETRTEEKK